ncbi:MAG TPA: hypothetical protein VNJ07_02215, partial [Chitinophagales bacterium]|nr:hypothetical protein [Chitinophagales bacterium]
FTDPNSGTVYPIKKIKVNSITGLPAGVTYQCNPSNCTINGGSKGCILISGTPTAAGTYPTVTNTTITVTIGTCPLCFEVPIDTPLAGIFVVQPKDCAGICGGTATVDNCGICSGGITGILPNCDDGDACTQDTCNGQGGCTHQQTCTVTISGKIQTETGVGIPGVTVNLTGTEAESMVTASDGLYSFTVALGGSYTVTPSKSNDVITNNGVTTADISLIRKQVLTNNFFTSAYKIIAADANNSGTVSTADITFTRKVVLSNTQTFPLTSSTPLTYGRLWEFVNSDQVFPGPPFSPFPFARTRTYNNISQSYANQNFIGVKVGDVNNTWNAGTP